MARETVVEINDLFHPPTELFAGVDAVLNCAGIVAGRDLTLLDTVNAKGPPRLAARAKANGVRQFVQLSSLHVYGYANQISHATPERPQSPYGWSKLRADTALKELQSADFAVSILRLPMLYGGGCGDNLLALAKGMNRIGLFPAPKSTAARSVLHVDNLAVVLAALLRDQTAGICLTADDEPFTLELLAEALGVVSGRMPRVVHLPDMLFAPIRATLKGLHWKLYQSNLVSASERVVTGEPMPIALREGLVGVLSIMRGNK